MTINYQGHGVTLHHGDALDVLRSLPDASVHAVVTDPPYGLGFMGKDWDNPGRAARATTTAIDAAAHNPYKQGRVEYGGASYGGTYVASLRVFQEWCELWAVECLRVLKPGGHLLAFGGTRTWHRLACAVEDAGFEIRDSIAWLYGSGFPKSLDVSKAIDKAAPRVGMPAGFAAHYAERRKAAGLSHADVCRLGGFYANVNHGGASVNWERGHNVPTPGQWTVLADILGIPHEMWATLIDRVEAERVATGLHTSGLATGTSGVGGSGDGKERRDASATDAARQWEGWGTALKPAHEPVVVARKPLGAGTVAANVQAHGTGALNIDACRINPGESIPGGGGFRGGATSRHEGWTRPSHAEGESIAAHTSGRWPANVILDDDTAAHLDEQSGTLTSGKMKPTHTTAERAVFGQNAAGGFTTMETYGDSGGASRFFTVAGYDHRDEDPLEECPDCLDEIAENDRQDTVALGVEMLRGRFIYQAKAPKRERPVVDGVAHPTVKPLTLMRHLVRLVTPPGGTVLEPFAGSGTTVEACLLEGVRCIAIEKGDEYLPLIRERIRRQTEGEALPEVAELTRPEPTIDDLHGATLFDLDGEVPA